jgi:hypothetical protein
MATAAAWAAVCGEPPILYRILYSGVSILKFGKDQLIVLETHGYHKIFIFISPGGPSLITIPADSFVWPQPGPIRDPSCASKDGLQTVASFFAWTGKFERLKAKIRGALLSGSASRHEQ